MKKIVVLTHNPVRDSVTDDCLSVALKKKGHVVWRRKFLDCDKGMVLNIKPDILILPEIRCEYTRDYAEQCRKWGIQVVVRPCEVGISEESLPLISEEYRKAIFGENWPVNNCINLMLCWGPKMKGLFAAHSDILPEKLVSVGGIAFDQFFLPPPPEQIQRTAKKRVLFATGFAYADRNPQYSMPEAMPDHKLHQDIVAIDLAARSKWFAIIKEFWAKRGDDWEIWIKPHPGERPEVYTTVLRDTFSMCPQIPPVRALHHVDAVVHAGSTMAYEAHLVHKPAFNLLNVCQDVIVSAISPPIQSAQELIDALDNADLTQSNAHAETIATLERDYYGPVDGNASERAADFIDAMPPNPTAIPDEWPPIKEAKYLTDCVLQNIESWHCSGCGNSYTVQGPREMVKCPFCGIANVKMLKKPEN